MRTKATTAAAIAADVAATAATRRRARLQRVVDAALDRSDRHPEVVRDIVIRAGLVVHLYQRVAVLGAQLLERLLHLPCHEHALDVVIEDDLVVGPAPGRQGGPDRART